MRRRRRFTASRHDSFSEEGEDDEAELTAVLARAGVAGFDGGVLGSHGGGGRQWLDLGLGFDPENGENELGRERRSRWASRWPFSPREQVARMGGAAAWRHSARTVATGSSKHRYYRHRSTGSTGKPN